MIIYDGEKYKHNRNEFRFNACFIVPSQADALKYEVAVRKLAKYLRTLEVFFFKYIHLMNERKIFSFVLDGFMFFNK